MRISTSMIYELGVGALQRQQSELLKTQQQLASGRRIMAAADDPAGAARSLEVSQAEAVNAQYGANRGAARDSLNLTEGALQSVTGLIQDMQQAVVAAGNGTLSNSDRAAMAVELRGRYAQLLGLANSTDGAGRYLFSGFQGATQPFAEVAGTVVYSGDQGSRLVQVGPSRQLATSENGAEVFEKNGLFDTVSDLATLLETPVTSGASASALNAGLASANQKLEQALDDVLAVRAGIGARLNEIDALESAGEGLAVQYQDTLSRLQDVDYARAISDLSQQQTQLEAAQQSFLRVSGLSLFDYL